MLNISKHICLVRKYQSWYIAWGPCICLNISKHFCWIYENIFVCQGISILIYCTGPCIIIWLHGWKTWLPTRDLSNTCLEMNKHPHLRKKYAYWSEMLKIDICKQKCISQIFLLTCLTICIPLKEQNIIVWRTNSSNYYLKIHFVRKGHFASMLSNCVVGFWYISSYGINFC